MDRATQLPVALGLRLHHPPSPCSREVAWGRGLAAMVVGTLVWGMERKGPWVEGAGLGASLPHPVVHMLPVVWRSKWCLRNVQNMNTLK